MNEVEGINPRKADPHTSPAPVEDSKISISHLLIKGYVEDTVVEEPFVVQFKSLTTEQIHAIDSLVVVLHGLGEHRASRNARYMKYLSRSIETICIHKVDSDNTFWDFSNLGVEAKEEALGKMSAFIFNKLFGMYMIFEDRVGNLIKTIEVKKS